MANGKIHGSVTVGASVGLLVGFFVTGFLSPTQIFLTFFGVLLGLVVGPDLDVDENWRGDYLLRKIHLEWLYDWFWGAYRVSIKHRSPLSHLPGLGSFLRVFYGVFPLMVVIIHDQPQTPVFRFNLALKSQLVACVGWVFLWYWWFWLPVVVPAMFLGLVLSDTLHWMYDQKWAKALY